MRKAVYETMLKKIEEYKDEESQLNAVRIYLKKKFNLSDENVEDYITDGYHDQDMDAIYIDEDNKTLYLIQVKNNGNSHQPLPNLSEIQDIKSFSASITEFLKEDNQEYFNLNKQVLDKYNEYHNYCDELAKIPEFCAVKNIFITTRSANEKNVEIANNLIEIIDIEEIFEYLKKLEINKTYPDLTIKVKETLQYNVDGFNSKVCIVSLKELKGVLSQHKYEDLLFENPRYSYHKSGVNSSIKETLESEEVEYFYLYNNGITIMCDTSIVKSGNLIMKNCSIINGGQTTYELLNSNLNDIDGEIMLRINERLDSGEKNDTIAINLNNQNPINTLFIYSKDPMVQAFKKELEDKTKYFLEIKDNEYVNIRPEKKLKKNVLKLENVLRILIASTKNERAVEAKNSRGKILNDKNLIDSIINTRLDVEKFLKVYDKWLTIESYIKEYRRDRKKIDEITDKQRLEILNYKFINTSNYLLLFTIEFHNIEVVNTNVLDDVVKELYNTIEEIQNDKTNISKSTQSISVSRKIKKMKLNEKLND